MTQSTFKQPADLRNAIRKIIDQYLDDSEHEQVDEVDELVDEFYGLVAQSTATRKSFSECITKLFGKTKSLDGLIDGLHELAEQQVLKESYTVIYYSTSDLPELCVRTVPSLDNVIDCIVEYMMPCLPFRYSLSIDVARLKRFLSLNGTQPPPRDFTVYLKDDAFCRVIKQGTLCDFRFNKLTKGNAVDIDIRDCIKCN